jgi:hypothetical protein
MATTLFNDLVTFSRGTNATVVGPNGLIQWAPANLLTNSESFDNAAWTKAATNTYPFNPNTATYGSNVSGTLLNSAGWIVDGCTVTANGAGLDFAFTGSNKFAYKGITVTAGRWYRFSVTVSGLAANILWSESGLSGSLFSAVNISSTTLTSYFFATTSTPVFGIAAFSGAGTTTVSSISVNEVIGGIATAPDGTATAEAILENTATSIHRVQQAATVANGTACALSVFVQAIGDRRIYINAIAAAGAGALFDMTGSGAVVNVAGTAANRAASITAVGNGWYRCTLSGTGTGAVSAIFFQINLGTSTTAIDDTYAGNGNSGLFLWGAQLELGSTATAYNPTTVKNQLAFSEAFDNAAWGKTNVSIVTGAQANPINGLFNGQKLMENTTTSTHALAVSYTVTNAPNTLSVFAKAAGRDWIRIGNDSDNQFAYFNLTGNGSIGTTGGNASAVIFPVGNGWYRCAVTHTPLAAGGRTYRIYLAPSDNNVTYAGDGNSGVYIWGAQLAESASLDAYVPSPGPAPTSTAYYGPRFDYDPVTLAPRGLLIEEARTNVVLTSSFVTLAGSAGEQYPSGTGWSSFANTGGMRTYVASAVFAGAQAMDVAGVSAARNFIGFSFAAASSTTYTVSFYVESVSDVTGIVAYATGALGTGGTTNSVTAPTAPGRYSYTFTTGTSAGSVDLRFGIGASGLNSGSIRISNVQCEAGAFATSYIPTVGSTVLRSADVAALNGSNFSGWFNASEGAFVADFDVGSIDNNRRYIWNANDSGNQRLALRALDVGVSTPLGAVGTGSAVVSLTGNAFSANASTKIGMAYGSSMALAQNGGLPATNATAASVSAATLGLGSNIGGSGGLQALNGHLRSIAYFNNRLSNAQLQALTELPLITSLSLDFINNLYEG